MGNHVSSCHMHPCISNELIKESHIPSHLLIYTLWFTSPTEYRILGGWRELFSSLIYPYKTKPSYPSKIHSGEWVVGDYNRKSREDFMVLLDVRVCFLCTFIQSSIYLIIVCVCTYTLLHLWRSWTKLWESVLFFYCVVSKEGELRLSGLVISTIWDISSAHILTF